MIACWKSGEAFGYSRFADYAAFALAVKISYAQGGLNVSSSYCEDAIRISDDEQLLTAEL